jgi:hypothetical protein
MAADLACVGLPEPGDGHWAVLIVTRNTRESRRPNRRDSPYASEVASIAYG